jgi:hypothetical protein
MMSEVGESKDIWHYRIHLSYYDPLLRNSDMPCGATALTAQVIKPNREGRHHDISDISHALDKDLLSGHWLAVPIPPLIREDHLQDHFL